MAARPVGTGRPCARGAARPRKHACARRARLFTLTLCLLCWAGAAGEAGAQESDGLRRELDAMLARQDALERENRQLREQLGTLEQRVVGAPGAAAVAAGGKPPVGLNSGGGGVYIAGEDYSLQLFGYAQAVGSLFDGRMKRREDGGDFSVRAARLDFYFDYLRKYQLLIEVDAAAGNAAPGQSDFGLVVASLNTKLLGDALQLELGKIVNPFSTENYRSSRDIDTIERYQALNSLFLLPGLDAQYGAIVHGKLGGDARFGYYLGAFNGNGDAFNNLSDSNGGKELSGKLTYSSQGFSAGLGVDYSRERAQTLSLTDLGFNNYLSVPIEGRRLGMGADVFLERGAWSLRSEGLAFRFELDRDPPPGSGLAAARGSEASLVGGFVQPAVYLWGDRSQGLQLLLRAELSRLGVRGQRAGETLYGLTLGANWYLNSNVRLQLNGIAHYFDGPSSLRGLEGREWVPMLLSEVQIKF
jgi:hypothetical protein